MDKIESLNDLQLTLEDLIFVMGGISETCSALVLDKMQKKAMVVASPMMGTRIHGLFIPYKTLGIESYCANSNVYETQVLGEVVRAKPFNEIMSNISSLSPKTTCLALYKGALNRFSPLGKQDENLAQYKNRKDFDWLFLKYINPPKKPYGEELDFGERMTIDNPYGPSLAQYLKEEIISSKKIPEILKKAS